MTKHKRVSYLREQAAPTPSLLDQGADALTDHQLLAVLLTDGDSGPDPIMLAQRLLDGRPLALLRRVSARRLQSLAGAERAARLLAAAELGCRILKGNGERALSSPKHVQAYAQPYATAVKEHFLAIHLNTRHIPLLLDVVSVGTLSASLVHPREVFRRAITEGCANLVLVHNHPSGDPAPSPDDIEITTRLVRVGELVGIEVLDHVILAGERYFSFREEGLIGK
jgi:DNA repair protein RadC